MTRNADLAGMQEFYKGHAALVTSPFITVAGGVRTADLNRFLRSLGMIQIRGPVLDLGCGSGLLSRYFHPMDVSYVGLDINNHPGFQKARGRGNQFVQGDALRLPFKTRTFGTVVCVDSFEHYPDPIRAAMEIRRVLDVGGRVFLSVPNYANMAGVVKKHMETHGPYRRDAWAPFDFWKRQEREHFVTPEWIRGVFLNAGFLKFRMVGIDNELCYGLLPWLWHPACPHRIERGVRMAFSLFDQTVVRKYPRLSLHTLWCIS